MNPLVRKEIRLLLPAWSIALLLACVSPWIGSWAAVWIVAIGAIVLAVTAFGRETALGTFSVMLAEPVPRERVFQVKAVLLAVALVSVLGAYWLSYVVWLERFISNQPWIDSFLVEHLRRERWSGRGLHVVWLAVIFAGGLWTTLVFRQMVAAFWVTILVPGCLVMGITLLGALLGIENTTPMLVCALIVYSFTGVIGSWRLFQRTEDTPSIWSSKFLPSLRELAGIKSDSSRRRVGHPVATLLRQEISLHQVSLIGAGALLLLNLGSIGVRASGMLARTSDTYKMLEMTSILWLLVPLIVGASAISEERRLGTLEGRLCLPVTQRRQYLLKLAVATVLGLLFGAVALLLTDFVAYWLGVGGEVDFRGEFRDDALSVFAQSFGLVLIGFYASSLSRSSLQALGAAIGIGLIGVLSLEKAVTGDWRGFVSTAWIPGALWATLFLVTMILAYRNFTHLHCGLRRVMRNVVVIVVSLSTVATLCAGIYWRAWEFLVPLESKHGPPVIAGPGMAKMVVPDVSPQLAILLPDGRVWISEESRRIRAGESHYAVPTPGRFLEVSNWTDIAAGYFQMFALRSDGTLWSIRSSVNRALEHPPRQIGSETNWVAIAAGQDHLLALKDDGTLWGLGQNGGSQLTGEHEVIVYQPVRIGEDSDWVKVFARGMSSVTAKEDGTWWQWGTFAELREGVGVSSSTYQEPVQWEIGFDPADVKELVPGLSALDLLLREDGSLWAVGQVYAGVFGYPQNYFTRTPIRVGENRMWEDVDFQWGSSVGVTSDGALLLRDWRMGEPGMSSVSRHSDWIAVSGFGGTITALAADGTVCCWLASEQRGDALAPSRRPLTSFNIFDEPE